MVEVFIRVVKGKQRKEGGAWNQMTAISSGGD